LTTAASPPPRRPPAPEQFHDWLAQKHHGEMAWLERNAEKRTDPQQRFARRQNPSSFWRPATIPKISNPTDLDSIFHPRESIRRHRPLRPVRRLP
jgi:hypothetical protein